MTYLIQRDVIFMTSNYSKKLYNDYEKLEEKYINLEKKYKLEKLRADVAESEQQRLEKLNFQKYKKFDELTNENTALKNKIIELRKMLNLSEYERDQYLAKLNIDGTNAGIPTSQTPINKKKIIPNSRKNTGGKIGGK